LLLVLLLLARPGAAQNLARLKRMWGDAAQASGHVDSLARLRQSAGLDTVVRGNLVVLAPPSLGALSTAVAETVWAQLQGTFGDHIKGPAHRPLVVALYSADSGPAPYGFPPNAVTVPIPITGGRQLVPARALLELAGDLRKDFDRTLDQWLGGPIRTDPAFIGRAALYEDLVTSPSPLARGCYVGSLSDCAEALGLVPTPDPATRWYDAAGRRDLLRNLVLVDRNDRLVNDCVEAGVDAACIRLLRGPDSSRVSPPLAAESRQLLTRLALLLGGPTAFQHLLDHPKESMGRRLELASGMPIDSLTRRWRTAVLSTRPVSVDLTPGVGWAALVWALVLGTLVLGSSRWRF
jgi:hypothetical protein